MRNPSLPHRFPGGATTQRGTSTLAVHTVATKIGDSGDAHQAVAVRGTIDRSRAVERVGTGNWSCPFPAEADLDQVDEAAAVIAVSVGPDGSVRSATIDSDPGHGFGREARACALRESYTPALDRDGTAVAATKRFRVFFTR
jgi:protein TonB